mmetsp:Transcript_78126/g.242216  ORF Transcript_78126/g.242216 Transcript_78126/m.242216 type:complete len:118 (+) Transcript_78126:81-434(+)
MALVPAARGLARGAGTERALAVGLGTSARARRAAALASPAMPAKDTVQQEAQRHSSSSSSIHGDHNVKAALMPEVRPVGRSVDGYVPVLGAGRLPLSDGMWQTLFVVDFAEEFNPML